jgi:hypothetical protein
MTWTPSSLDDLHFLVVGNQAGDLLVFRVSQLQCEIIVQLKVSESSLVRVQSSAWYGSRLFLIAIDAIGCVILVTLQAQDENPVLTPLATWSHPSEAVCNNAQVCLVDGQVMVACAYPGLLIMTSFDLAIGTIVSQEQPLGYLDQTAGILFYAQGAQAKLLCLGHRGKFLALDVGPKLTLSRESFLYEAMTTFIKQHQDRLKTKGQPSIRFFGITGFANALAAIAFEAYTGNQPRYFIPTQQMTSIHILHLDGSGIAVPPLLSAHLQWPLTTSLEKLQSLASWKRFDLLSSLQDLPDAPSTGDLSNLLFGNPGMNMTRLRQALSSDLDTDLRSRTEGFLLRSLIVAASQASHGLVSDNSMTLLARLARFVLLFRAHDTELIHAGHIIVKRLEGSDFGPDLMRCASMTQQAKDNATDPQCLQSFDSCQVCEQPIYEENSLTDIHCARGHVWHRCCVTLAPIMTENCRRCTRCNVFCHVPSVSTGALESLADAFLKACAVCPHCSGKWRYMQPEMGVIELDPREEVREVMNPPTGSFPTDASEHEVDVTAPAPITA